MAYTSDFPIISLTVDAVVLAIRDGRLCAVVVTRGAEPFKGRLALPGGFVDEGESLDEAVVRELKEETGIALRRADVEQLATYGDPKRDPRGRTVSVAHLAAVAGAREPVGGDDAADAQWHPVTWLLARRGRLAFDHALILRDAVARLRTRLESSPVAASMCGRVFTIAELRRVYELVWGVRLDPGNFHRKVTSVPGFIEPTGQKARVLGGRPAELYRPGPADVLRPPMTRAQDPTTRGGLLDAKRGRRS